MDQSTSVQGLLKDIQALRGQNITAGRIMDCISDVGFSVGLLALALMVIAIPVPKVPPLNFFFALPFAYFGWQMVKGQEKPQLPEWLANKSIEGKKVKSTAEKIHRLVGKFETHAHPSLQRVVEFSYIDRIIGITVIVLTSSILLPLPFTSSLPAFLIALMALGQIHKDGRLIIAGICGAALWMTILVLTLGETLDEVFDLFAYAFGTT